MSVRRYLFSKVLSITYGLILIGILCFIFKLTLPSDVLAQHLRRCDKPQNGQATVARKGAGKQTRAKRACDRCAKLKLKCTFQEPCDRCRRKSLTCEYTRAGYLDPYDEYRIGQSPSPSVEDCKDHHHSTSLLPAPNEPVSNTLSTMAYTDFHAQSLDWSNYDLQHTNPHQIQAEVTDMNLLATPQNSNVNPLHDQNITDFLNMDALPMDFDFGPMFDLETIEQLEHFVTPKVSPGISQGKTSSNCR